MRKYRIVEVSETELEDLVRRAPELIEAGLKLLTIRLLQPEGHWMYYL